MFTLWQKTHQLDTGNAICVEAAAVCSQWLVESSLVITLENMSIVNYITATAALATRAENGSVGHGSAEWWVTWVMGHKMWPIVSSVCYYHIHLSTASLHRVGLHVPSDEVLVQCTSPKADMCHNIVLHWLRLRQQFTSTARAWGSMDQSTWCVYVVLPAVCRNKI